MAAGKSSRINRQYKTKYRIRNWREYERGLRSRGDVTIWLSEDAIAAWIPPKNGLRGGRHRYSNLAIRTGLTLRVVFGLPLRQTEGFLDSLLSLMSRDLKAPDGIVKLTHHKLRQPQDIVSRTTPEYSMGRLAARQPVNLTMPQRGPDREVRVSMPPSAETVLRWYPRGNRILAQPNRDVSAAPEATLVLPPVPDSVLRLVLAVDSARLPCGHDVAPLISMMDRNPPPMLACPLTPIHAPMPWRGRKRRLPRNRRQR